jgi:hypothetical protein
MVRNAIIRLQPADMRRSQTRTVAEYSGLLPGVRANRTMVRVVYTHTGEGEIGSWDRTPQSHGLGLTLRRGSLPCHISLLPRMAYLSPPPVCNVERVWPFAPAPDRYTDYPMYGMANSHISPLVQAGGLFVHQFTVPLTATRTCDVLTGRWLRL